MSRKQQDYEEDIPEEELIEEPEDNSLEYSRHEGQGESIVEKASMDKFFDTETLLYAVEKTCKGYQKRNNEWIYATKPLARDAFINSMINSLRSVINQQNMISTIKEDDAKYLLLEKNKEFIIERIYDEPSIEDSDVETIVNIFDHAMELFMGHVINGHGSRTFRQVSANVSYEIPDNSRDDSLFNWNVGDKNLIRLGGRK